MKEIKIKEEGKGRIVVMGGSFNPPTIAHYKLMKAALDGMDAEMGFFVPVSDAYLKRKLKQTRRPIILSPETRVNMLEAMTDDGRMKVWSGEIGTIEPRTVPTLHEIQESYPGWDIYFVMGDDKLGLLSLLTRKRGMLRHFQAILFSRNDSSVAETLAGHQVLAPYMDRIHLMPSPGDVEDVSSSLIRKRKLAGESCVDMLHPGVEEIFARFSPEDFPKVINMFRGEYSFLSLTYRAPFVWEGVEYGNALSAFLASQTRDEATRKEFGGYNERKAKFMAKGMTPYEGWEAQRDMIMEAILEAKFSQNPELKDALLATGDAVIIYGNSKKDTFWGVDTYSWRGENRLGELLMKLRGSRE